LDNHVSRLSIIFLDFCKENGIVLLSFPPHTTNHLQPLDVSVYGPFKTFYYTAASVWMDSHPGVPISIYDIPIIVKEALPLAATPKNILSEYKKTGIWPYNRNTFTEEDYLCSSVTDRIYTGDSENHNTIYQLTSNTPQSAQTPICNKPQHSQTPICNTPVFTDNDLQYTTKFIYKFN